MYDEILGMELTDAIRFLSERGVRWRVSAENGKTVVLTMDYNPNRINLNVINGKITSYSFG